MENKWTYEHTDNHYTARLSDKRTAVFTPLREGQFLRRLTILDTDLPTPENVFFGGFHTDGSVINEGNRTLYGTHRDEISQIPGLRSADTRRFTELLNALDAHID